MNFEKEAFSWALPIYQRWERKGYLVSSITKPCDPVIVLRRTSTSTRSIAHELFAEVLLKYRFGIIQWKMGVVIRGEVCSMKLKSSPEILHVFHSSVTLLPSSALLDFSQNDDPFKSATCLV